MFNCILYNMTKKRDTKFVEVSIKTHERLGNIGRKNEKYGAIVERLLDIAEEKQMVECK